MKIVNRGFIITRPKQAMVDWVNQFEEEFALDLQSEPSVYLIEEDFLDEEPVIKSNFKSIFRNELMAVSEDEFTYPEIKLDIFKEWFTIELGTSTFDAKEGLQAH